MTAAALAGALPADSVTIDLVESDEIGTIGVGEATLPQMKDFNDQIGVIEPDMMRNTQATFKLGIEFVDWGFKGSSYIHPFGAYGQPFAGTSLLHHWTRARLSGKTVPLEETSFAVQAARAEKFDFPVEEKTSLASTYAYAYHLDASLYAKYLRKFSEDRGARRTEGKIVRIQRDTASGNISEIVLESGRALPGDLFIDCTGFRSLLLGKELGVPFESWKQWLRCDRAVAVPSETTGPLVPYTRATAKAAGWQWRIPLQHRTGNGYVFSSDHLSDDEATASLLGDLKGPATGDPRIIRFEAGRRTHSWVGNCVAIGLSSGFLEPLESTSIYLIQAAIQNLLKLLPEKRIDAGLAAAFNRLVDAEYDRVRDFLILHYKLSERQDSELWRYCRDMDIPESLAEKIEMFRNSGFVEQYRYGLFAPPSWISVFVGQGLAPEGYDRKADNIPLAASIAETEKQMDRVRESVSRLPSHESFVRDYCPARMPASVGA